MAPFICKLDLQVRKLIKCYIWSIALDGAKPRTLPKAGHKYPEMFKTWCWRKTEKIKFFVKTQPSKRDYNFVALQSSKLKTQPKCSTPLLGNPKVHYPLHISPLIFRVLSQISPVYILPVLSLRIILIQFVSMSSKWFLPFRHLLTKTIYALTCHLSCSSLILALFTPVISTETSFCIFINNMYLLALKILKMKRKLMAQEHTVFLYLFKQISSV